MKLTDLRKVVTRAAGDVAAIAQQGGGEVLRRRELVSDFERILQGTVAGLENALAERGAVPSTPISTGWPEPTIGALVEFFRAELLALDTFDRNDLGTLSLIEIWMRTYSSLRTELVEGPLEPVWPCPMSWLELQLFRLAWRGPGRVTDYGEYNRLNRLMWERRDERRREGLDSFL